MIDLCHVPTTQDFSSEVLVKLSISQSELIATPPEHLFVSLMDIINAIRMQVELIRQEVHV